MKWIITFLAIVITTIACEKASVNEDLEQEVAATSETRQSIIGTWRMVEYYEDRGDGVGQWRSAPANSNETITFTSDGRFSASSDFPNSSNRFDRYKLLSDNQVTLSSTSTGYSNNFQFVLESPTQLRFHPRCRENCMRRYELVSTNR